MKTGWLPGDMVLGPGILVLAISRDELPEHALLLIRGRPWDVLLITDTNIPRTTFQLKGGSTQKDPGYLIFHPCHCRIAEGGEARDD